MLRPFIRNFVVQMAGKAKMFKCFKTIMTQQEYIQLKAFARIDGAIIGVVWIASFALCIAGMTNPGMSLAGTFLAVASPLLAARRLTVFRDNARDGIISFRRSMAYYILIFFYASLLMALAQYVYFAYMDHGYVLTQYTNALNMAETKQMLAAAGISQTDTENALAQMRLISPIMMALNIMTMNITVGIVLSPLVALVTKRSVK